MSELETDLEQDDEVRRLVTRPERDLVVPPFAAVVARARRGRSTTILVFAAAAAVLVFAVVASSDTRRPGAPGDATAAAQPQTAVRVKAASSAVLSIISSEVRVRTSSEVSSRAGTDGEALRAGTSVQAEAPNGRAVITFRDGSTIELEPGTTVSITEVSLGERDEIVVRVTQDRGRSWAHVQSLLSPNSRFHVTTPSATAVVRGTSFEIDVTKSNGRSVTTVNVFQGQVDVVAAGMIQMVTASQTTKVVEGSGPQAAKEIGRPPVCLRMQLTSTAMMTVTDPYDRSVGRTPRGTVGQIPHATVNNPTETAQVVDVRSPTAGEWEVGIVASGDGGDFQLSVDSVAGPTAGGRNVVLTGSIRPGQRMVAAMRISDDGRVTLESLEQTSRTRAKIADIGSTTTAPLPQAKSFGPAVDRPSAGCVTDSR